MPALPPTTTTFLPSKCILGSLPRADGAELAPFFVSMMRTSIGWRGRETGRRSRRDLVILRLPTDRMSCHHPDDVFTRVSHATPSGRLGWALTTDRNATRRRVESA